MDLITLTLREFTAGYNTETKAAPKAGSGSSNRTTLRRCRTREQGTALINLGHAIEYLVNSRVIKQPSLSGAEREALAILVRANLSVYNDGMEIVPIASRLRRWFHGETTLRVEPAGASISR